MKAIVKRYPREGLWLEDLPIPPIGDHEVRIQTLKSAICGTDIHIYKWDSWAQKTIPIPMVIGHEFMGKIVELGKEVKELHIGDKVSGEGHITCGHCIGCLNEKKHLCRNVKGLGVHRSGCFAEYFSFPAENVFVLPEDIPDDLATILDPFGNAVHSALSAELTGEDVLITGAGPIGCMAAAIAKKAGARYVIITDISDYRLELAKKMGATLTVNITKVPLEKCMKEEGILDGFSVGLEMSGHSEALQSLIKHASPGATIALLGIITDKCPIDWDLVVFKMLTLKGIYGRQIFSTWFKMAHLLEAGLNLSPIVTHHFPADRFQEAFDVILSGMSGKVILEW